MRLHPFAPFAGILTAGLLLAAPLAGQQAAPQQGGAAGAAPVAELVFEREVFQYPTYQRRNPFRPLVGAQGNGPRFEQVALRGIIWSADPQRSVALFGLAAADGAPAEPGVPTTKRLKIGEVWGNMRVTEIQKDRVVVSVEEFGLSENKTLELTRRQGGGVR